MESLRLFIALLLPPQARSALRTVIERLQGEGLQGVRWVRPEGIHLTLKFLGNVHAHRVEALFPSIARVGEAHQPFHLALGGLGTFPSTSGARVIWVGVQGEVGLLQSLQRSVEEATEPLGFPVERRSFSPHLTLGRLREGAPPPPLPLMERALAAAAPQEEVGWQVKEVCLMRSILSQAGARYELLAASLLGDQRRTGRSPST